ncbi:MAG: hypothetical protein NT154_11910 [Verrucomicrobia bacterium]|nr:hypothetical protein [Verrucomicrobiota bacterium]
MVALQRRDQLVHLFNHVDEALAVALIALKHSVSQFKPMAVEHHPKHDLRTVIPLFFWLASFGLGIAQRLPLKITVDQRGTQRGGMGVGNLIG